MNEEYYQKQIKGLILIISDGEAQERTIGREYVKEKLEMILNGGIGFHETIKKRVGL